MKIRFYGLLFTMLCTSHLSHAQDPQNLQSTMTAMAATMQEAYPLIFTAKPIDEHNSETLEQKIDQLIQTFSKTKPHLQQKTPAFKASYQVLMDHLQKTQTLLKENHFELAQSRLRMLPTLCVSCHTQDSQQKALFVSLDRNAFSSDFEYAEFSYATRDYGAAITYYDKFLTAQGVEHPESQVETTLERLLTLYVQVDKEPSMAATYLEAYLPFIQNPLLKQSLEAWIQDLKTLPENYQEILSGEKALQFQDIEKLAVQLEPEPGQKITPDESYAVPYVILRGLIHHYLNENPSREQTPKLLYWLALCDKRLNYQFYHSFADLYLKECFQSYPNSPYASKCKLEFESYEGIV